MIVIRRTPLIRFIVSKWPVVALLVIGMILFIGCGDATYDLDDQAMAFNGTCVCDGTTLKCDPLTGQAQSGPIEYPNSQYCDKALVQANSVCSCVGTSLQCSVAVCTFEVGGCYGIGAQDIVAICDSNMMNSTIPNLKAESSPPGRGQVSFANDPTCLGAPPKPNVAPAPGTPSAGGGSGCTCEGVDYICKAANGSVTSASYNAAECGGSGACGCREPNSTLACPDGTFAEFNPTCTGGGSGCTLTKDSCVAQGYYDVDLATCTCLGKP